jgi:hypothetical protein
METTATSREDTATTTPPEDAETPMESDSREPPAERRMETTTPMEIDTEAPADTPGRLDSLFGSGVSTPAVS